jgi:hypothetical protein
LQISNVKVFKVSAVVFIWFLCKSVSAQSPQLINYQSVVRNTLGQPVPNGSIVALRFSIHNLSALGTTVFRETQTDTANQLGLVNTQIGLTANLGTVDWSSGPKYLQVELDINNNGNFVDMGTSQLLSVPYALYAANNITHYIGELYEGGIIVTVWKVNGVEHGLIASLVDISVGSVWSNVNVLIGALAQSPRDGLANTNAIITQTGQTTSAALLCHNYSAGGYTDWYLPAVWELNQCFYSALIVNTVLGNTNGFKFNSSITYWSSTEDVVSSGAWYEAFYYGYQRDNNNQKSNLMAVRAVRKY